MAETISFEPLNLCWIGENDFGFFLVAEDSNICCSHSKFHLWASPSPQCYKKAQISFSPSVTYLVSHQGSPDVLQSYSQFSLEEKEALECQNVTCRAENRAALWLRRTPGKPLRLLCCWFGNLYCSGAHLSLQHSEVSGKSSRHWLE